MNISVVLEKWADTAVGTITAAIFFVLTLNSASGQPVNPNPPPSLNTAANPPVTPLSLNEAEEIAFEKNWDLLAAKSGIDAASAQLIVAKEFPNPIASWSTSQIGSYEAGTSYGNGLWARSYETVFAVNQLIEIAGKRHDRQMSAKAGGSAPKPAFMTPNEPWIRASARLLSPLCWLKRTSRF
jgi:hypothetical protein